MHDQARFILDVAGGMAYGRNTFDEQVLAQHADTPVLVGSHTAYIDTGAVFGLRGTYSF